MLGFQKQENIIPDVPQTMDGLLALVILANEKGMDLERFRPTWVDIIAWLKAKRIGKQIIKEENGRYTRVKALLAEITRNSAQTNEAESKAPEIINTIRTAEEHLKNAIKSGHGPHAMHEVCSSIWNALEAVRQNVKTVRDAAAQSAFSSLLKAVELQDEITEKAIAPPKPQRHKKPNKITTADRIGKIPAKPVLDVEEIIEESGITDPQKLSRLREIVNEMCSRATS